MILPVSAAQNFLQDLWPAVSEVNVTSLCDSAADCQRGSLFLAVKGTRFDGHDFIPLAIERGAVLVLGEPGRGEGCTVPYLGVPRVREVIGKLAAQAAGNPSERMLSFAVTGTNGKTTTHSILADLLEYFKIPVLRTGTLGAYVGSECLSPETLTTPGPLQLNQLLLQALKTGARGWCTEASSHALSQDRLTGQQFDGAIFTNLTRDHLDYHGNMEEYFHAKGLLFDLLARSTKPTKCAVIHVASADEDPERYGNRMAALAKGCGCNTITFGTDRDLDIQIVKTDSDITGTTITIREGEKEETFFSPLLGAHNVENVIGCYVMLSRVLETRGELKEALKGINQVPGRLERIVSIPFQVFVDYAHTPDALERVLKALRPLTKGRLWALFGCGGDRDTGKRPQMLQAALTFADEVVVTSDNPRTEDPLAIIADILAADTTKRVAIVEGDRRAAIKRTLQTLTKDDTLVIAGKGHEDYQIIGTQKFHFSDQEEVRSFLQRPNERLQ
jgi:UDP-N-acetylmuramoyl-L-alanyl-D-glutamate--2,6-diaminopimelate ligase